MSCQAWQDLLQQHLDGDGAPDALDRHLQECPDCAAHQATAVRRLRTGLDLLRPPAPSADLADRIVAQVLGEVGSARTWWRRRLLPLAALAAAAAVLLAVSLWAWWPGSGKAGAPTGEPGSDIAFQPEPPSLPATPFRDSVAQGATAVAALTSRTAAQTMDQTASLLPLVPRPPMETLAPAVSPMDPSLQPLREASAGVSSGLAPVTDSARRAVNLFLRDLPMGRSADEDKPG